MSYSHFKFSTSFPSTKFIWGWVNAFFFAMLANNHPLSSGELTVRPLQMRLGRLVSTKKLHIFRVYFNLPEGNHLLNRVEDQAIWLPGLTRSGKSAPTVDICRSIGQWEIFTGSFHVVFTMFFITSNCLGCSLMLPSSPIHRWHHQSEVHFTLVPSGTMSWASSFTPKMCKITRKNDGFGMLNIRGNGLLQVVECFWGVNLWYSKLWKKCAII